ncbi:TonB-dependent receptor [Brumicola pallidula]|jgi:iron complex outermembrane receptor protein|uniref:TonB-dependent receptor n=1 Tax=Brumicola pallidula DSM 14239 = ACAM 615 TaxID=1121922 RepID=K6Z9P2_9ALTE|nr:TonB-dependent receptor [Glaciecola pallidula]GAC27102.1 TonB-dependent receptor [Glaciecola pallidula DSM 14239 = ACAM 615]
MKTYKLASIALCVATALQTNVATAQETQKKESVLEKITVTAQKRTQSIQDVPISVATLSGEQFESIFSGGEDILALAVRVPGLYAESSNGRVAPRFYIRGLGNTDFDLAASQPVSIIMDDVVKENVILKSFPLFDIQQVEVIRGPQGTLFGRNTTAGIIKFDSVKPTEDFDAYGKMSLASFGTINIEGAVGGGLADNLAGRFSFLSQQRDDYIDNAFSGEDEALGGYDELAWRAQLLFTPIDDLSMLLNVHGRDLDGTASVFRANVFTKGSNDLNQNYDRDSVFYDGNLLSNGFDNNPQEYENLGFSLKVDYDLRDLTFTSITANEEADGFSLGDVDGGAGSGDTSIPGFIPFTAVTQDKMNDLEQFTQEFRIASNYSDALNWQVGSFYYDSSFNVTSIDGFFGATTVFHENKTWAIFGQGTYDVSDKLTITGGLRYTDDEKSLIVGDQNVNGFALVIGAASVQDYDPINVQDEQVGYELSANYKLDENSSLFARYANGFRAQSIQGRDVAFEGAPSVAEAETISSVEFGVKSDMLDNSLRLNAAVFYYTVDDIQFSAIGGGANSVSLLNADKGSAYGFEIDATYVVNQNLVLTGGYSYNKTEIEDNSLSVFPCGANAEFGPNCTVTDPMTNDNRALINGNPFPQAPETIFNFTARYSVPMGDDGEFFAYTDWAFQGKTNFFLYESVEFQTDNNFEAGLRIGYENFAQNYTVAIFARNLTDEDNVKGAIDFNNLAGIMNEPRVIGIEGKISFF